MRPRRPAEDALARVVLERHLALRRGDALTIEAWSHALPWAGAFVVEARRRGIVPTLVVEDEAAFFRSIEARGAPVVSGPTRAPLPRSRGHVYLGGPAEFPRLLGLPPTELDRIVRRHDPSWWRRARRNGTRAVRVAVAEATAVAAARYGVDLDAWQRELIGASRVDPGRLEASAVRLLRTLGRARVLRVRHPNGTDLMLTVGSARPIIDSGRPDRRAGAVWGRVPSGLLAFAVAPRSPHGVFEANRPAFDRFADPPAAVGGRFEFDRGRLVTFEFERGGEVFADAYARGGRAAGRVAALTIGLNPHIDRAPEAVELGRGSVGLLLGDGPFGRGARASGFGFLAVLAGAEVLANGRRWLDEDGTTGRTPPTATRRAGRRAPRPSSGRDRSAGSRSARR
jgi:hypothetical protein